MSYNKENSAKWYLKNREKIRKNQSDYRQKLCKNDPAEIVFRSIKSHAKEKELEFNLEKLDINVPSVCPILDIPIFFGKGKLCDNSPSVDRLDNTKGYIKGNIRIISVKANRLKGSLNLHTIRRLLAYMEGKL